VDVDYHSGDDFVVEFLDYRYGFSRTDFTQRVVAAAIRLELVPQRDLSDDEAADLVALASAGGITQTRSALGRHLQAHHVALDQLHSQPLSYWLRKLVFRGAWLDHRVKEGLLEVAWDEETAEFAYRDPRGDRALLELLPVPSWHDMQFRR
jgi:hypothetical protein